MLLTAPSVTYNKHFLSVGSMNADRHMLHISIEEEKLDIYYVQYHACALQAWSLLLAIP